MKISFIDLIRSAARQRDEKFRQKLYIFLVCLVISIIIWFTIKLSDEYDMVIQMPVTYTHIPKNKVLTYASDTVLQVEIIDKGSNLFRLLFVDGIQPVKISLRFLPLYLQGNSYHGTITPSLLINEIEREQNLLGKIVSVSPDSIYLSFEPEKSRKVPVKAKLDLSFEKQYMRSGPVDFEPDSVTVKGPEHIIEKLDSASLGKITLEKLNENFSGEIRFPADSANQFLSFSPPLINYYVPVEKFTEAETEVQVKIVNANGLKIKTFPDRVKVYYTVTLKDYPKVEPGMISIVADLNTVNLDEDDKIQVGVESNPDYIRINKIEPEEVEFIIVK